MKTRKTTWFIPFLLVGVAATVYPQQKEGSDTNKKIEVLTEEIEKLKTGNDLFVPVQDKEYKRGLGPAASKVYKVKSGLSIGGYGEFVYENYRDKKEDGTTANKIDQADALRGVLYVGYKFNDWILLNTEYEWEHANEVSLEFGYLDFMFSDALNVRAGLMLVPMGFVNQFHEPVVFYGAKKPVTETLIIPAAWRENGTGLFGNLAGFEYTLYVMNGFDGLKYTDTGFRKARQKGSEAKAEDLAAVGRLDYVGLPGLILGVSGYYGNAGQNSVNADVNTQIADAHLEWKFKGLRLRALGSVARIQDTDKLNATLGNTGQDAVAKEMIGYYVELGYDIFRLFSINQEFTLFARYEKVNTQNAVEGAYQINPANDQQIITVGVHYQPIVNVVVKADYQHITNRAKTGVSQTNLAMGYVF